MRTILSAALLTAACLPVSTATAAGAGFDPRVIVFGAEREQIKSTPIQQRPNRPLHVYGNTVRRRQGRAATTVSARPQLPR